MSRSYASHADIPNPLAFGAVILVVFAALFGGQWQGGVPPSRMEQYGGLDAALAPADPVQVPTEAEALALPDGFVATPVAEYDITALVLSRRDYRVGREARVSPMDLVLGWGEMSNPAYVADLNFRQGGRFGFIGVRDDASVNPGAFATKWSNTHMVPATEAVREQLETMSSGRLVRMTGHLANISRPGDGFRWRSSTSRRDTGNGACEILLVQTVEFLD